MQYKYRNIDEQKNMLYHKNVIPRPAELSMEKSARIRYLARGLKDEITKIYSDIVNSILPGCSETVANLTGNGYVSTVFLKLNFQKNADSPLARIKIFTAGRSVPDIDQPVCDFFMSGWEGKFTISDNAGKNMSQDGSTITFYRHISIPYEGECRIVLENTTQKEIAAACSVQYSKTREPMDYGRYSRAYGCSKTGRSSVWGEKVILIDVEGVGLLHSFQLSMKNMFSKGGFMEGNIEVYIDNNDFPVYQSTGTEEFFMGGIYFTNLHTSSYSGCTRTFNDGSENPENIISAQRYFIDDPITFNRRLRVIWHNGQEHQGMVAGSTEYSFSGIYYINEVQNDAVKPVSAKEALFALSAIDSDRFSLPLTGRSAELKCNSGENVLISIDGAGGLDSVYLSLHDRSAVSNAHVILDIDGRRTDSIPIDWFFMSAGDESGYTGENGKTSDCSYYKLCDIPFTDSIKFILDMEFETDVSCYFEYRTGERTAFFRQGVRVISGKGKLLDCTNVIEEGSRGYIESILISGESLPQSFLEITSQTHDPLAVESLGAFFLCPEDFGIQQGISSDVGILSNHESSHTAFRSFGRNKFTFENGLRIKLHRDIEAQTTIVVFYKTYTDIKNTGKNITIPELTARLNINDYACDTYETRCHNPIEGHDGLIPPGETKVMFEDFDAGMIKCLRFGTPPAASALHESVLRLYLDGFEKPALETTVSRFFSAEYEDPIFWSQTRYLSRLSKRGAENPKNQDQHSSCFRYINIPYRTGAKLTLTAPGDSDINGFDNIYFAGARNAAQDFGIYNTLKCASGEYTVNPGERILIADHDGVGAITSVQFMAASDTGNEYLKSLIQIYSNNTSVPIIEVPVYQYFFGAEPCMTNPAVKNDYTAIWNEILAKEEAYYSAPENGWIRRSRKAPFRNVMYRLLERRPILLNGRSEVYLCNTTGDAFTIKTDLIIRHP